MGLLELLEEIISSVQRLGHATTHRTALDLASAVRKLITSQEETVSFHNRFHQQVTDLRASIASGTYDSRRFGVLYVDDEEKARRCFCREYGKNFRVLTAPGAQEALAILREPENEIAIVLADQRMPGRNGRWLLERARQSQPYLVRILVSTFPTCSELSAASVAARSGAIYGYVVEPWDPEHLEHVLRRALEYFVLSHELNRMAEEMRGLTS